MNQNVTKFFKSAGATLSKHSPEILLGIGITGMISTTVLAVKATPKALQLIEMEKNKTRRKPFGAVDAAKACWKCYIPAVVTGVASAACLIGAHSVHAQRNAAIAAAYKLSETALTEYREKVVETVGEKKEKTIREKVDKARIEKNPVSKNYIFDTGRGSTLCYDYWSGRYFYSDIEDMKKAVNVINRMIRLDSYASLNDMYDQLNLPHSGVGDLIGWTVDDRQVELDHSAQMSDDDRPCICMDFSVEPHHGFTSFW